MRNSTANGAEELGDGTPQAEAKADLLHVGRHTERRWDRVQRLRYLATLDLFLLQDVT